MDTDGIEPKHRTRHICVHPWNLWNLWLKQLRPTEEGELYDLSLDPNQYTNLWAHPASQEIRKQLLHRLTQVHMEREPRGPHRVSFA